MSKLTITLKTSILAEVITNRVARRRCGILWSRRLLKLRKIVTMIRTWSEDVLFLPLNFNPFPHMGQQSFGAVSKTPN
jgi:hypothetical protein